MNLRFSLEKLMSWNGGSLLHEHLYHRCPPSFTCHPRFSVSLGRFLGWYLRIQNQARARVLSTRIFLSILRSVARPAFLAALTITGLYLIERYARERGIWFPQTWRKPTGFRPDTYATLLG